MIPLVIMTNLEQPYGSLKMSTLNLPFRINPNQDKILTKLWLQFIDISLLKDRFYWQQKSDIGMKYNMMQQRYTNQKGEKQFLGEIIS